MMSVELSLSTRMEVNQRCDGGELPGLTTHILEHPWYASANARALAANTDLRAAHMRRN